MKLREILVNDILIGNNKKLINTLKQGNINITNFCKDIKKNYN